MNLLRKIITTATFITAGLMAFQAVSAFAYDPLCSATDSTGQCTAGACANNTSSSICQQDTSINGSSANPASHTIGVVANVIASISAIIAVIMIVIAGLTMVTSGGNSDAVSSARSRIIYASVGLIIIALAWTITTFFANHLVK